MSECVISLLAIVISFISITIELRRRATKAATALWGYTRHRKGCPSESHVAVQMPEDEAPIYQGRPCTCGLEDLRPKRLERRKARRV